jgi:hypothetical protein
VPLFRTNILVEKRDLVDWGGWVSGESLTDALRGCRALILLPPQRCKLPLALQMLTGVARLGPRLD